MLQALSTGTRKVMIPSELANFSSSEPLEKIRVGGRVTSDEINYEVEPRFRLQFSVSDPGTTAPSIPVVYRGIKPDMFAPGRDVIIDGSFRNGALEAVSLLTQCPSKYEPPSAVDQYSQQEG